MILEKVMKAAAPSCTHKYFPTTMVESSKTEISEDKMLKSQKKLNFALLRLNHGGKLHPI